MTITAPSATPTGKKTKRLKRKQLVDLLEGSVQRTSEAYEFNPEQINSETSQFPVAMQPWPEQIVPDARFVMHSPTGVAFFPEYRTLAVLVMDYDQLPIRFEAALAYKVVKWFIKGGTREEILDLVAWLDSLAPEANVAA